MAQYEAVIGLEVHAQLRTRTKIFCRCATGWDAAPNSRTCPVCLGHPGALPVLNGEALRLAVRAALALDCEVQTASVFARKHYFYPDLPKGYQISQYDRPLALGGRVEIDAGGVARSVGLIRLHLEEDAGKSVHDGMPESDRYSYVDLNRAGTPLVEIVSLPQIHRPEEAYRFLERLRSVLRYSGVCDGNLERGSMRCDANVSIRPRGAGGLGTRTELKNLNSFRNVQRALEFEIERQIEVVESGGAVEQQTLAWDAAAGRSKPLRGKEEAEDYRYFPEPDLPTVMLSAAEIERRRAELPELPAARKARMLERYGLGEQEAHQLTLEMPLAEYYEAVAQASGNPRAAANYVLNDLLRAANESGDGLDAIPLPPRRLAELIRMVDAGTVSATVARRELFPELYRDGGAPGELLRRRGLEQLSDEAALREIAQRIIAEHPRQVEQYRAGKQGLLGFFVGRAMQASGGRANPRTLDALLRELLDS